MQAILYILHGTRHAKGLAEATLFLEKMRKIIPVQIQELSFLELAKPTIEEGFRRCLVNGATEITIVPLFLTAGNHVQKDIPEIVANLQRKYPGKSISIKGILTDHTLLIEAIASAIRNLVTDLSANDRILIVGRGNRNPELNNMFSAIAERIYRKTNKTKCHYCFLAMAEPLFHKELQTIVHETNGRIIVVPYLLFSGILSQNIKHEVAKYEQSGRQMLALEPLSKYEAFYNLLSRQLIEKDEKNAAALY